MLDKMLEIIIAQLGLDKSKIMAMAEDIGNLVKQIDGRMSAIERRQALIMKALAIEEENAQGENGSGNVVNLPRH
jgi:hypothetical protein